MTLQVHQVHHSMLEHLLQGGIIGGKVVGSPPSNLLLHGLTLVFNAPAGTVTFTSSGGVQEPLTLQEIKTQIEAAVAVTVTFSYGQIAFKETVPSAGVDLDATGTANALLGFGSGGDAVGTFYNPPGGGAPELVSIGQVGDGFLQVVTSE